MQHEQKEEVPFVRDAFASTDFVSAMMDSLD